MLLRWLFCFAAGLTFLVGSATAFAASGVIADGACCCPDPDTCKCHDHDGDSSPAAELKRCAGEGQLVAPELMPPIQTAVELPSEQTAEYEVEYVTPRMPASWNSRPETPPF